MKAGDLVTLLEKDGYYILVERDRGCKFGNRWWKIQSLTIEGEDPVWTVEPRMELVSGSR